MMAQEPPANPDEATVVLDEVALVRRCQEGEPEAFAELVRRYQDRVYNLIVRMVNRPEDAEELTQEVFLKAFAKIGQFHGMSRFYTWLFRIAKNLTISHRRRARRVKFHSLTRADDAAETSQADEQTAALADRRNPGPEANLMQQETARRVTDALAELDEEYRLVVVLRDIEDMDYRQIAEVLDVPAGTVKSRLSRARGLLREKLNRPGELR
jgi:RNA polymerase sigma-70 factor (ECF subfamily)